MTTQLRNKDPARRSRVLWVPEKKILARKVFDHRPRADSGQAAMGWSNTHLCCSRRGCTWGARDPDFGYGDGPSDAGRTTLLDMIADIGTNRFEYVYDFGDHWSHTIKIVKPMPAVPGVAYPLLIDAVGRHPIEDSLERR